MLTKCSILQFLFCFPPFTFSTEMQTLLPSERKWGRGWLCRFMYVHFLTYITWSRPGQTQRSTDLVRFKIVSISSLSIKKYLVDIKVFVGFLNVGVTSPALLTVTMSADQTSARNSKQTLIVFVCLTTRDMILSHWSSAQSLFSWL